MICPTSTASYLFLLLFLHGCRTCEAAECAGLLQALKECYNVHHLPLGEYLENSGYPQGCSECLDEEAFRSGCIGNYYCSCFEKDICGAMPLCGCAECWQEAHAYINCAYGKSGECGLDCGSRPESSGGKPASELSFPTNDTTSVSEQTNGAKSTSYQGWGLQQELVASDAATDDFFGNSVAMDGNIIVVGTRGDDDLGEHTGSVYIWERSSDDTWYDVQKLTGEGDYDNFGQFVAISNEIIVVGTLTTQFMYIYLRSADTGQWKLHQKIETEQPNYSNGVVGISGNTIVISNSKGGPLIYERNSDGLWSLYEKREPEDIGKILTRISLLWGTPIVTPMPSNLNNLNSLVVCRKSSRTPRENFGHSVGISGSMLVVGTGQTTPDAVYVYQKTSSGWTLMQKVGAFGFAVAIDGNRLIADKDVFVSSESGTWLLEDTLEPSEYTLAFDVDISGNTAVLAMQHLNNVGEVHVFVKGITETPTNTVIPIPSSAFPVCAELFWLLAIGVTMFPNL